MAIIKFGNIVVDMRGKVSGNVYAKNKGGAYSRVLVKPTNPKTAAQSLVRAAFTALSQAWRAITGTQRLSWNQATGNYPRINALGDSHNLSGNALFVSLNKNLSDVGIAQIDDAPAPATVEAVTVASAVADNSDNTLLITLDAVVPANTSIKIFASDTLSAGVNSVGSKLRQIGSEPAAAVALLDLTARYIAKFGAIGSVGSKIFFKLVPVNETTGQVGAEVRGEIVIQT